MLTIGMMMKQKEGKTCQQKKRGNKDQNFSRIGFHHGRHYIILEKEVNAHEDNGPCERYEILSERERTDAASHITDSILSFSFTFSHTRIGFAKQFINRGTV
ncbi:MAG: hypothetical protein HY584_01925 [Candidatus Omnitrophica bacterium]|nr:hypothetical protein [Candidatus Omnitrophota bacterium]